MNPSDQISLTSLLERARDAHARREWPVAYRAFKTAAEQGELSREDLIALGDACWWMGAVEESIHAFETAYHRAMAAGDPLQATYAAQFNAWTVKILHEPAQASGWIRRASRVLADLPERAEHGYIAYYEFETALERDELESALAIARQVQALGQRFGDPTLQTLGILAEGRALIQQGAVREGMELLDEAMLAALGGNLRPSWTGNIYCHLMIACSELQDHHRAAEWTEAINRFWDRHSATGPFVGICRAYRAEVMRIRGDWDEAEQETIEICTSLPRFSRLSLSEANYQLGEIRRLRGDLAGAEEAFTQAHTHGRDPQPGLALLRLAQGRGEVALASIQAAIAAQPRDCLARFPLRAAQVEIALAMGDLDLARQAGEEVEETARVYQTSGFTAAARQARGAILLAEGRAEDALPVLRSACLCWSELSAPYETARLRCMLARAYHLLGDDDAAERERDAAVVLFAPLGAPCDLIDDPQPAPEQTRPDGLTDREIEVLQLVAAGLTNRAIAEELFISQKTVARHIANIFTKLTLSTRTAAAAYAIEQGLVGGRSR
jgi:ATP/maltotriose-dependent transcriptional regulator MalT